VRLNPNVPFKTRGNAAVCIEFETDDLGSVLGTTLSVFDFYSDVANGANAGMVVAEAGANASQLFREVYRCAMRGIVSYARIKRELVEGGIVHHWRGNGMGLLGATASLGFDPLADDHTYEIIAYRRADHCGTPRKVDEDSVKAMDRLTHPHTFSNYDYEQRRVLLTPHGRDPVFLGIRGDAPELLANALSMLRFDEPLAGHMVYVSNQCTDAHLSSRLRSPLRAFDSGWLEGRIRRVRTGRGGHLYLDLVSPDENDDGQSTSVGAIYRPTRDLVRMGRLLARGDRVRVFGGVRRATATKPHPLLNVEKIEVLDRRNRTLRPSWGCPACGGRRLKSEGRGKGFQCRVCKKRLTERPPGPNTESVPPPLPESAVFLPSPGAQRHLTKPFARYGAATTPPLHPLVEGWFSCGDPSFRSLQAPAKSPR
jgi:tRNA(Ile2)-agmatinylcytidine synthase